ncbi:MAG: GNAT family N-acetyltransferase [bacterium]|nr:GNAT family N-acetyltransferase [bacterium]
MKENPLAKYNTLGLRGPVNPLEREKILTKRVGPESWQEFKQIKLEAIETDPVSFGHDAQKIAAARELPDEAWQADIERNIVVVTTYDNKPIALARGVQQPEEGLWTLHAVFVSPKFHKNMTEEGKVAEDTVKKVIIDMKNAGGKKARLWVRSNLGNAIKLYERLGFKKINPLLYPKQTIEGWRVMEAGLTNLNN